MSLSLNITIKIFETFSHERNEECDNTVFKQHNIFAFITADLITREVMLVVGLHELWLLLQAIYFDGLATTSLFNSVEFLKNNVDMELLLFIFPYVFYL